MRKDQIKVGGVYMAKVDGVMDQFRVTNIYPIDPDGRKATGYDVTNLRTGRKTTFESAAKFREEVKESKPRLKMNLTGTKQPEGEQSRPPSSASSLKSTVPAVLAATSTANASVGNSVLSKFLNTVRPAPTTTPSSQGVPHVECPALAGTGKTTTVVQGLIAVKGGKPSIEPSEQQREVWRQLGLGKSDTVRVSAFNKSITSEMQHKLDAAGLLSKGVECKGIHGLGFSAVMKQFGRLEPSSDATKEQFCQVINRDIRDVRDDKKLRNTMNATCDLVSLCKQTLTDPDSPDFESDLNMLCSRFDIEIDSPEQRDQVYELVPRVMEHARQPKRVCHWDDMVWLPVVHDLPLWKCDVQIVDEAQDLNRMQQELVYKAGKRIIYVGDRNQAIYGFAGADSESMDRMRAHLSGREGGAQHPGVYDKGLTVCPLTVTRRCGKAIVREAQKYVPEFEAHESNAQGSVKSALWTWKGRREEKELVPWEKTYGPMVKDGAMVLCRTNAPIVSECFRFLKRGIKATILGKNIGSSLITFVKKADKQTVPQLIGWLSDWQARELEKEQAKRFPSESKQQAIMDKVLCVTTFCEEVTQVSDVIRKIENVFADKKCPKCGRGYDVGAKVCENPACRGVALILPPGVKFSSIHKSKGLEAKQVFYIQCPESCLPEEKMQGWEREQERNLRYVATTRAIEELYHVR